MNSLFLPQNYFISCLDVVISCHPRMHWLVQLYITIVLLPRNYISSALVLQKKKYFYISICLQCTIPYQHIIPAETRSCLFYLTVTRQDKPSAGDLRLVFTNCMATAVSVSHLFSLWRKCGRKLGFSGRASTPKTDPFSRLCLYSTYCKNSQPLPGLLVLWWHKYRELPGIFYIIGISDIKLFCL